MDTMSLQTADQVLTLARMLRRYPARYTLNLFLQEGTEGTSLWYPINGLKHLHFSSTNTIRGHISKLNVLDLLDKKKVQLEAKTLDQTQDIIAQITGQAEIDRNKRTRDIYSLKTRLIRIDLDKLFDSNDEVWVKSGAGQPSNVLKLSIAMDDTDLDHLCNILSSKRFLFLLYVGGKLHSHDYLLWTGQTLSNQEKYSFRLLEGICREMGYKIHDSSEISSLSGLGLIEKSYSPGQKRGPEVHFSFPYSALELEIVPKREEGLDIQTIIINNDTLDIVTGLT